MMSALDCVTREQKLERLRVYCSQVRLSAQWALTTGEITPAEYVERVGFSTIAILEQEQVVLNAIYGA
jgi:hypothetical protein